jgi:hypothetical protein
MARDSGRDPRRARESPSDREQRGGFWWRYWERFRRQQVDDPVERSGEPSWERFRRQQVDDPVDRRVHR